LSEESIGIPLAIGTSGSLGYKLTKIRPLARRSVDLHAKGAGFVQQPCILPLIQGEFARVRTFCPISLPDTDSAAWREGGSLFHRRKGYQVITRAEAIATIESVIQDAERRVTKPLSPELVAAFRAESLAAYDANPSRFPTAGILAKYVKFRTSAKPPYASEALANPPSEVRRGCSRPTRKPILDEMSPGGENALRSMEGE
jgi:hypothetical protein